MKERWKDQALGYCIDIFNDYTRAEISELSTAIVRAWKVGKRASSLNNKPVADVCPCGCTEFIQSSDSEGVCVRCGCVHIPGQR